MILSSGIIGLDQQITLAINSLHSEFTDSIWLFFSKVPVWFPLYAIVVGCLFWRLGWKKALVFVLALGLTILCCDQLANLAKDGFGRLRPCNDPYMVENGLHILKHPKSCGFFSGHAANSFGFACCSIVALTSDKRLKYRGYAVFILLWALLVSLSRVFVSAHFFGDILVGGIVGSIIGYLFGRLGRYFGEKYFGEKATTATSEGQKAYKEIRAKAESGELPNLTLDEINEEINLSQKC